MSNPYCITQKIHKSKGNVAFIFDNKNQLYNVADGEQRLGSRSGIRKCIDLYNRF